MKKTLITLLALSSIAMGATNLTYWAENNNVDLCTVVNGYLPYLGNAEATARAPQSVLDSIKTAGNTDYNLNFKDTEDEVSFIVNDALYFNQILTSGSVGSYAITFGANGSLTAATKTDKWGGAIQFTQGSTVTLTATVSLEQRISAASGDLVTRTLISSTDTTSNAMWNVTNNLTVNAVGLEGLKNVGLVTDTSTLKKGEYGYIKLLSKDENQGAADGIALVYRVPEPTTATLSLLALAGLAARRRRR